MGTVGPQSRSRRRRQRARPLKTFAPAARLRARDVTAVVTVRRGGGSDGSVAPRDRPGRRQDPHPCENPREQSAARLVYKRIGVIRANVTTSAGVRVRFSSYVRFPTAMVNIL